MIRQFVNARQPIPERYIAPKYKSKPKINSGAFFDLDQERTHVDNVSRIKLSQIEDYAERYGYNERQTEELIYFIRAIDKAHCDKLTAKHKAESKSEQTKSKWKTRR